MSRWDEIKKSIGVIADKTANKTRELTDTASLKITIASKEADRDAEYKVLGKLTYAKLKQHKGSEAVTERISETIERLDKINDVIYNNLKYALQYRYGKDYSSSVKVIIKNKDALRFFPDSADTVSGRIQNLRLSQSFSLKDTSEMTGISEKHLCEIEKGQCQATADDVRRIATAFKTSGDYIIFGKKKGDFANGFINQ